MTPLLAALLAASTPAHALSCAWMDVVDTLPRDGATEVPINAQPVVRMYGGSPPDSGAANAVDVTLVDQATGEALEVSVDVVEADGPSSTTWRIRPAAQLPAETTLSLSLDSVAPGELSRTITFSTGAAADLEAPDPTTADSLQLDHDSDEWGDWRTATVGLAGGEDEAGSWWRIELADNPDFDGALRRASLEQPARYFDDPCNADAAATAFAGETWVRVTTIDAAGNEAEPQEAMFGDWVCGTTMGCSTTGGAPGPLAAFAGALGLVGLRRRRR